MALIAARVLLYKYTVSSPSVDDASGERVAQDFPHIHELALSEAR
ncbi:hypothetical protein L195_g056863 [Trifolium pratense]|uniref:Uncharacterized protein n=1 Tax=Trifolium pratense TaxID=57577 RepID=A0A2K3KTV2_TRIPR|nr:hypothetical protein L195_g056863 [Trifolium pratense]